jgi:hypothetical protein
MAYALWRGSMPGETQLQYHEGQLYNNPYTYVGAPPLSSLLSAPGGGSQYGLHPLSMGPQQKPAAPTPTPSVVPGQVQNQVNRLTGQARDALYGGILGYQPQSLVSGGDKPQTFAAPQGGFRFPFGLLNGSQGGQ